MRKFGIKFLLVFVLTSAVFSGVWPGSLVAEAVVKPKLVMTAKPLKEYKNGDKISVVVYSPNYKSKVQYRVTLRNESTKKTYELWNTPKTGYYYTTSKPAGNYKTNIVYPINNMTPGTYSLTVYVRRLGTKVSSDSYVKTSTFVIKSAPVPSAVKPISFISITGTSSSPSNYGCNMVQDGDWIYYYDYKENGLCKIKYDGTGKVKLSSGYVRNISIAGDFVYFISGETEGLSAIDKIRKVKVDGTGNSVIYKCPSSGIGVSNIAVYNNLLYYLYNSNIFTINLDGSNNQIKYMIGSVRSFMVYKDQIYYTTYNPEGNIFRVNFDGTGLTRITDVPSYHFTIDSDWIYYTNEKDNDKIYRASITGITSELLYSSSPFANTSIIEGQKIEKVNNDKSGDFKINSGWIYYNNNSDN
jgi:hypothetical protein